MGACNAVSHTLNFTDAELIEMCQGACTCFVGRGVEVAG
jgi:hypothetical protein